MRSPSSIFAAPTSPPTSITVTTTAKISTPFGPRRKSGRARLHAPGQCSRNRAHGRLRASVGLRQPGRHYAFAGILIYSGVFDRFPKLKLCTCHGGGFFPYHVSRFDREFLTGKQATRRADRPNAPRCADVPSAYFKNLYFDTLVYDVETLDFLRRKVGADHLMLGTDFPYVLGDWQCVDKVEALPCSEGEKRAILDGNARKLLKLPAS